MSEQPGGHEAAGMMRWLLTYADVITLLLIVFTLMYAFSQVNAEKFEDTNKSLQSVFGYGRVGKGGGGLLKNSTKSILPKARFNTGLSKFGIPNDEVREMTKTKEKLSGELRSIADSKTTDNVNLLMGERGLVISMAGQVLFDPGKADITDSMKTILDKTAPIIKDTTNAIRIEGFTDDNPISNEQFKSNWELSTARATTVLRYFIERHGIPPHRFSASGYGEYKPLYENINDVNRSLNRRVDVVLLYPTLESKEPE